MTDHDDNQGPPPPEDGDPGPQIDGDRPVDGADHQPEPPDGDTGLVSDDCPTVPVCGPGNAPAGDLQAQMDAIARQVAERVNAECESSSEPDENTIEPAFVRQCFEANELGDGMLFKAANQGQFVFNKSMDSWMAWAGHHWVVDQMGAARAAVENVVEKYAAELADVLIKIKEAEADDELSSRLPWLRARSKGLRSRISQLRSRSRANNCLDFAHNCTDPMAIKGDEIDRQPMLMACANGVINLETGDLEPGRQESYLLKASPIAWQGIDAPCDLWEQTLTEIFSEDDRLIAFVQRLFGYALISEVRESIIAVFTGIGRNGKSLIVEVLSEIMGPMAGAVRSEMLLDQMRVASSTGPTPDIMALRGLRLAFASETDDGCRVSPSKVKWLTGKDKLTGRNPHDKYEVQFSPTHTLFLLTNHTPHAPADDFAFWERVVMIPFKLSFVNRRPKNDAERVADPMLANKLAAEYPGILAWMVRGCLDYQERGLDPPPVVQDAVAEYQRNEDIVGDFLDECCVVGEKMWVGATALYDVFERWWHKNVSKNAPKQKRFGSLMGRRFERVKDGIFKYKGVGLIENVDDLFPPVNKK